MKIGLVLPDIPKYSETFFNYKIKSLSESGLEVKVFCGEKSNEKHFFKHYSSYPVYKNKKIKQLLLFIFVLGKTFIKAPARSVRLVSEEIKSGNNLMQSLRILYMNAHIITHNLDWLHFGYATMSLKRENVARIIGAKMGVSFRGYDINIYPLKNPGCYKKLWNNVDKVHTISDYLYRKAVNLGLSERTDYNKITPAIDSSLFRFKSNAGKINTPLRILTVGRLNWIKNYETAIAAVNILIKSGLDVRYEIIGTGQEFERLKFAVYQSDLDEKVNFKGKLNHKEITLRMQESDIYLQTSYQEGFCVSVLEAQATGLLCIVSDADGLKENVIDGETGWIVNKRDPAAFAEKIQEVINLPEEQRKKTAINARKRAEMEFNLEQQKSKFIKFFTE